MLVTVTVADDGEGTLTVTKTAQTVGSDDEPEAVDENAPDAEFINEQLGAMKVTKKVTVNGEDVTDANKKLVNGTFAIAVTDTSGNSVAAIEFTVQDGT